MWTFFDIFQASGAAAATNIRQNRQSRSVGRALSDYSARTCAQDGDEGDVHDADFCVSEDLLEIYKLCEI